MSATNVEFLPSSEAGSTGSVTAILRSSRVVLPSRQAMQWLFSFPPLFYLIAIALGLFQYNGLARSGVKVEHALAAFDKHVFRPYGSLLPFAVLFCRVATTCLWLPGQARSFASIALPRETDTVRATLVRGTLILYSAIAAIRLLLYLTHVAVQVHLGALLVSDHIFLGSAIVACLHCELVCCMSDFCKLRLLAAYRGAITEARLFALATLTVTTGALFVATSTDMYFTGRYFHTLAESAAAFLVALVVFQAPLWAWLFVRTLIIKMPL